MGTEENSVNLASFFINHGNHLLVNAMQHAEVEQVTRYPRLISGHNDPIMISVEPRNRFQTARVGLPFVGGFDVVGRVAINDAVPV